MNENKFTTRLLVGLFLTTFFACNNSLPDSKQIEVKEPKHISSILSSDNKYQIDTAIILTNQNLASLIDHLDKASLTTHNNTKYIPDFIKTFLDTLTTSDFSIANPGEEWQVTDVVLEPLPTRELVYLGLGKDIALFAYFSGGIGKSEHVLIFRFKDKKITDFWSGNVLVDLESKSEIIGYLKKNKDKHWGLNTNIIYL